MHRTFTIELFLFSDGRRGDGGYNWNMKGPNGVAGQQWMGMDNPEYHMTNNARAQMYNGMHPQQTLGVPVLQQGRFPGYSHGGITSNGHSQHLPQQSQPQLHPHPQERPHEYYNELATHAPHSHTTRSETTV